MIKYSFANDYSEGCHPSILEALMQCNTTQEPGYGDDTYTQSVATRIKTLTQNSEVDVHLIAGGTLTNLIVLAAMLRPYESVIAADTGHIYVNEAGAIEATGHKIETVPTRDGKLRSGDLEQFLNKTRGYHVVKARAVYISNSTELGTIYTKEELTDLSLFCRQNDLLLYMDGARLAMALAAKSNDLILADISRLTDVFYIGGTKCGALLGEAVVISNNDLKKDFKYNLKQRGALMAKGRVLGIQFDQLLAHDLLFDLAKHANAMAMKISESFKRLGYQMLIESDTNQVFPILSNSEIATLENQYSFLSWKVIDSEQTAVRLITSWATSEIMVDEFIHDLDNLRS